MARPRARRSDPATSHQAARSVGKIRESQRAVLVALAEPGTDEQIYERLEVLMSPSGARTRRKELVDLGLVVDSGQRELTRSNRKTIVWRRARRVVRRPTNWST